MINETYGIYTRTAAFNLLKELLDIPKNAHVNKNFFELFFIESEGFYSIIKPKNFIKKMFDEKRIKELNKKYYQKKEAGEKIIAQMIAEKIILTVKESFAA